MVVGQLTTIAGVAIWSTNSRSVVCYTSSTAHAVTHYRRARLNAVQEKVSSYRWGEISLHAIGEGQGCGICWVGIMRCCCAVCKNNRVVQTIHFANEGVVSVTDQRCLMLVQE